jgi:hypothetical protein
MRLGNKQYSLTIEDLMEREGVPADSAFVNVDIWAEEPEKSDDQSAGWHLLLGEWIKLDAFVAKNVDELKTRMLIVKFGAAKVTDQHGNETFIPVRRTTQIWNWDKAQYTRKKLSKKLYSELITLTYDMAAGDSIDLPELKREAA